MKNARTLIGLCMAATVAGCGGGAPPDANPPAEQGAAPTAPAVTPAAPGAAVAARAEAVQSAAAPSQGPASRFPHTAHAEVPCRNCHGSTIPGHATHAAIGCRECHAPPTVDAASTMTHEECMSCHHGRQQTLECSTCHAPVAPRTVERTFQLSVWKTPRTVSLPFDHARHESVQCSACHAEPPLLLPDRACGSCHKNHHRPDADCASCHNAPPPGVHPLSVHEGCSASGCHAETAVADLPESRSACLVCHRDRIDHQPGRDCRSCHWPVSGGSVR